MEGTFYIVNPNSRWLKVMESELFPGPHSYKKEGFSTGVSLKLYDFQS